MLDGKKTYKVDKTTLLDEIKTNRAKHIELNLLAKQAYRLAAGHALRKELEKVDTGEKFSLSFSRLIKPTSHREEYDQVIGLLELSQETTIEITPNDYKQYVLDQWHWTKDFAFANSSYGIGTAPEEQDAD